MPSQPSRSSKSSNPTLKMRLFITALALWASSAVAQASPPIRNIYTFPPNHFIENIAVRSNSRLLLTSMSVPHLYSINPLASNPAANVVHTFANPNNATGISGIAEIRPDVFAVIVADWDLFTTRAIIGTLAVWTVDFNKPASQRVKFVTQIANSTIFNGIARHPTNPRLLLAADSALGAVWKVDLLTGASGVAFSSPLLTPTATAHLGINGLKAEGSHVYFTNSAQGFLGRVAVDWNGNKVGAIEVLSEAADAGANVVYDDIALDLTHGQGKVWVASHPSYAIGVTLPGAGQWVVNNTTKLLNPTACAFGRGSRKQEKTLYLTNGGEFLPDFTLVNEGVVAIDL
ncbi:hypothetical protein B0T25DRAFT_554070 [Lasiosphaeria hispida]|uniref:SMP-30/Gluconolactonase/LRE-like region domain-containing protein n=1 Tax=Lasiosphaeria hispida TaxID=260671 RepID=A0AAJ0HCX0_9PEZI|nr:hypothetical protein B0T25DRAFT_554070 [Lasiosphaeria hispida]